MAKRKWWAVEIVVTQNYVVEIEADSFDEAMETAISIDRDDWSFVDEEQEARDAREVRKRSGERSES